MPKFNLFVSGTVLASGLASLALAAQPIQAAEISITGSNGNWFYQYDNSEENSLTLYERATDLGAFDVGIALTGYEPNTSVGIQLLKLVYNYSKLTWTDFHITIGTGLGDEFTQLDPNGDLFAPTVDNGEGISAPFDLAYLFSGGTLGFAKVTNSGTYISFDHGTVLSGILGVQNPGVTAPAFLLNVPIDADGNAFFTLRQTASVPEPFTILGAGAALGFGSFFKRLKAKK
ncbi:PEP-CTERM sorting domain-containing protein [Gloeothece verrucosa]|uniref:PEP-CTERM protein-sorting domain-containing protein n=1 Tax=Gloeothece verrucosa (strain PCC 7822) TaxID=497965 RepID=E0UCJ7_GLOV7|nr:PEP-CTERM sorting domain-containing protein [Gloeothece verrucosa]ADN14068.1 hypothetical protein Cyan7822_2086 [Gloeothece verrucosa PCC 7822]